MSWRLRAPRSLTAALIAVAALSGAAAAHGWLCAFVLVAMVPIGSLALLLVHGVTGGHWGRDLAPVLIPAAPLRAAAVYRVRCRC